jgi:hypothetical protein
MSCVPPVRDPRETQVTLVSVPLVRKPQVALVSVPGVRDILWR